MPIASFHLRSSFLVTLCSLLRSSFSISSIQFLGRGDKRTSHAAGKASLRPLSAPISRLFFGSWNSSYLPTSPLLAPIGGQTRAPTLGRARGAEGAEKRATPSLPNFCRLKLEFCPQMRETFLFEWQVSIWPFSQSPAPSFVPDPDVVQPRYKFMQRTVHERSSPL